MALWSCECGARNAPWRDTCGACSKTRAEGCPICKSFHELGTAMVTDGQEEAANALVSSILEHHKSAHPEEYERMIAQASEDGG